MGKRETREHQLALDGPKDQNGHWVGIRKDTWFEAPQRYPTMRVSRVRSVVLLALAVALAGVVVAFYLLRFSKGSEPLQPARPPELRQQESTALVSPDASSPTRSVLDSPPEIAGPRLSLQADPATVSGQVTSLLAAPLPGAMVVIAPKHAEILVDEIGRLRSSPPSSIVTATDSEGRFSAPELPPGSVVLTVALAGYAPEISLPLTVLEGKDQDIGTIRLEEGPTITGHVFTPHGTPSPGATVILRTTSAYGCITLSGDDGAFSFSAFPYGSWSLTAQSDEYPPLCLEVSCIAPGATAPLQLVFESGGVITGRVIQGARATALQRVSVAAEIVPPPPAGYLCLDELLRWRTECETDGSFALRGLLCLPDTQYRLRVELLDSGPALRPFGHVDVLCDTHDVLLHMDEPASLMLSLVDRVTSTTIRNATIYIERWRNGACYSSDVVPPAAIRVLPSGAMVLAVAPTPKGEELALMAESTGYSTWTLRGILVAAGQQRDLGTIGLQPCPVLPVRVVDALTDNPIQDAHVIAASLSAPLPLPELTASSGTLSFSARYQARTDADGLTSLPLPRSAQTAILADHSDYAASEPTMLNALAPDPSLLTVRLTAGATVQVRVVGADESPQTGVQVLENLLASNLSARVLSPSPSKNPIWRTAATDATGKAVFECVAPGTYSYRLVEAHGKPGERVEITVDSASLYELTLQDLGAASVSGTIRLGGSPLLGARLELLPQGSRKSFLERPHVVHTDIKGAYRFDGLDPGRYELLVIHPFLSVAFHQQLELLPGPSEVDIDLSSTRIRGRVLSPSGSPFAAATVALSLSPLQAKDVSLFSSGAAGEFQLTQTDQGGLFLFENVPSPANPCVTALAPGFQMSSSQRLHLDGGEVVVQDLKLEPAGVVRISLRTGDGSAPKSPRIYRTTLTPAEAETNAVTMVSDSDGNLTFDHLKPGLWKLQISSIIPVVHDQIGSTTKQINVEPGSTHSEICRVPF